MPKKYIKDYGIERQLAPGGKMRAVAVYRGDWFRFSAAPEALKKTRILYLTLSIASTVLIVFLLCTTNWFDNIGYVTLPAALLSIPVLYLCLCTWRIWTAAGPVTREHQEKAQVRMSPTSVFGMALSAVCTAGCVLRQCLTGKTDARKLLFTVLCAALFGIFLLAFRLRGGLAMEKTEPPEPKANDA